MIRNFIDGTRIDNRLPVLMVERKISIRELAELTGVTYTMIRDVYHGGRRSVKWETIDRICQVLGVGIDDMFIYVPEEAGGEV
jgi:DNA-binding Xre family transcriptional regulator